MVEAAHAELAALVAEATEFLEEAAQLRIVGQVVEAVLIVGAVIGRRLDLGLDLDADDRRRDVLDHVGEARDLRSLDVHRVGQHWGGAGGEHACAGRADDGQGSDGRHQALAGAGI